MEDLDEKIKQKAERQQAEEEKKSEEKKSEEKKSEEKKKGTPHVKRELYYENRNNKTEEELDTFGMWPFKAVKDKEPEKKKRGQHCSGSFITKNIQITKDGTRVAYGGGK